MLRLLTAAAFAIASLGVPAAAQPFHPCACGPQFGFALPFDGQEQVPTNARIWFQAPGAYSPLLELYTADYQYVPMRLGSPIESHDTKLWVFLPEAPLAPDSEYRLQLLEANAVVFRTGSGPTVDAPATPQIVETEGRDRAGSSCGDDLHVLVTVAAAPGTIAMLDRGGETSVAGTLGDDATFVSVLSTQVASNARSIGVGPGIPCNASNWDGAPGDSTTIRVGAFDASGRFSGWSEPTRVTLPGGDDGCSGGGGGRGLPWALLLLVLALRRRRRLLLSDRQAPVDR